MGSIAIESIPSSSAPRILIIGAGQRGNHYSKPLREKTNAIIAAVAEPNKFKRQKLGETYIWGPKGKSQEGQEFCDWKDFIKYEVERRQRASRGEVVPEGVDGVFVCTLDDQHKEIIIALAPLNLHIMSEKPLATTLEDCISIYASLLSTEQPTALFTIGHVLRYSPHNVLLHELVVKDSAIGEVLSMEHTEPVGWWHFSHSYVRGNWRKESSTAPSLLTKSCHDIDFLLWLLCSPTPGSSRPAHLPSLVTSSGSLVFFKKSRKPSKAGNATNCLSCPIERDCLWSAKKLYYEKGLGEGHLDRAWYSCKVVPEIEDCVNEYDLERAQQLLLPALARDYDDKTTPQVEIDAQPWYGRCVFEAANDVCDDQVVTIDWADDPLPIEGADQETRMERRSAKKAIFHMVAWTEKICQRRSRIYGSKGEIETDGETIIVHDFESNTSKTYKPPSLGGHHGGGDTGLATQFIKAIDAVKNHGMSVADAQITHIGCSVEEIIRSHAMVFAAEDSRKQVKVVEWVPWWTEKVEKRLKELRA